MGTVDTSACQPCLAGPLCLKGVGLRGNVLIEDECVLLEFAVLGEELFEHLGVVLMVEPLVGGGLLLERANLEVLRRRIVDQLVERGDAVRQTSDDADTFVVLDTLVKRMEVLDLADAALVKFRRPVLGALVGESSVDKQFVDLVSLVDQAVKTRQWLISKRLWMQSNARNVRGVDILRSTLREATHLKDNPPYSRPPEIPQP